MRLMFETVGRRLSWFKSTRGLTRGLRDVIYGHRQRYLSRVIHRDISEKNVVLSDDTTTCFVGCLLDLDYGFNWREFLKRAGWEVSEVSWKRYVEEYDCSLPERMRPVPPERDIPLMGLANEDGLNDDAILLIREVSLAQTKMGERMVRIMALSDITVAEF
ncbi:hypothetical protein FOMPIDRAFT_1055899 [Fomitopsis schrenkii]|uniref:Fungal-type protein kinase domain-containing protein n=1 Tax=Fomitopsis schrenkii TaxID=2126942 RepID=S8DQM6_FOMSC|nr:hypothetical protein FOMPIDRAFT_1055899 [Fomitopsis schrenkii]